MCPSLTMDLNFCCICVCVVSAHTQMPIRALFHHKICKPVIACDMLLMDGCSLQQSSLRFNMALLIFCRTWCFFIPRVNTLKCRLSVLFTRSRYIIIHTIKFYRIGTHPIFDFCNCKAAFFLQKCLGNVSKPGIVDDWINSAVEVHHNEDFEGEDVGPPFYCENTGKRIFWYRLERENMIYILIITMQVLAVTRGLRGPNSFCTPDNFSNGSSGVLVRGFLSAPIIRYLRFTLIMTRKNEREFVHHGRQQITNNSRMIPENIV